ncbi:hypothetical protein JCM9743_09970 [Natrinema sp. JCM 9743]
MTIARVTSRAKLPDLVHSMVDGYDLRAFRLSDRPTARGNVNERRAVEFPTLTEYCE